MDLKIRQDLERVIYAKIVNDALASGFNVSVHDGEKYALKHSTSLNDILDAGFSTDADALVIYDGEKCLGFVSLVYGNSGWDVISDYTATDDMEDLLKGANALASSLEDTFA